MHQLNVGPGLPWCQPNAHVPEGLMMRVGIPHRSGKLAFHAFEKDYPVMVSANAFWDSKRQCFVRPAASDLEECDTALDSAGFSAMWLWKKRGRQRGIAGIFPWTYAEYLDFATSFGASWYAQPDLCCEPEVAGDRDAVDYRVRATATLLEGCLQVLYHWHNLLARDRDCSASVIARLLPPPVPVLQGWCVSDYLRSLELLDAVWARWIPWLAPPRLIGIGSVCRRNLHDPEHGLFAVLEALEGRLPPGARAHLFGVKGAALSRLQHMPWIASADSMAYDFGARIDARSAGIRNSIEHRRQAMSRWMTLAELRKKPASVSAQPLLN